MGNAESLNAYSSLEGRDCALPPALARAYVRWNLPAVRLAYAKAGALAHVPGRSVSPSSPETRNAGDGGTSAVELGAGVVPLSELIDPDCEAVERQVNALRGIRNLPLTRRAFWDAFSDFTSYLFRPADALDRGGDSPSQRSSVLSGPDGFLMLPPSHFAAFLGAVTDSGSGSGPNKDAGASSAAPTKLPPGGRASAVSRSDVPGVRSVSRRSASPGLVTGATARSPPPGDIASGRASATTASGSPPRPSAGGVAVPPSDSRLPHSTPTPSRAPSVARSMRSRSFTPVSSRRGSVADADSVREGRNRSPVSVLEPDDDGTMNPPLLSEDSSDAPGGPSTDHLPQPFAQPAITTINGMEVVVVLALLCDEPLDDRLLFLASLFGEASIQGLGLLNLFKVIAAALCHIGILSRPLPPPSFFDSLVIDAFDSADDLSPLVPASLSSPPLMNEAEILGGEPPEPGLSYGVFVLWARSSEVPYTLLRIVEDMRNWLLHLPPSAIPDTRKEVGPEWWSGMQGKGSSSSSVAGSRPSGGVPLPTSGGDTFLPSGAILRREDPSAKHHKRRQRLRQSALDTIATDQELYLYSRELNFSVGELRNLRSAFARHASKHGASLGRQAFHALLCQSLGSVGELDTLERLFDVFDIDGNGAIDFHEFLTGIAVITRGSPEERLRLIFRVYDRDGDGSLSVSELLRFVKHSSGDMMEWALFADDIVASIDVNGDGVVSREEFCTVLLREPALFECFSRSICKTLSARHPLTFEYSKGMAEKRRRAACTQEPLEETGTADSSLGFRTLNERLDFATLEAIWSRYARDDVVLHASAPQEDGLRRYSGDYVGDAMDFNEGGLAPPVGATRQPSGPKVAGEGDDPVHRPRHVDLPGFRALMAKEFSVTPAVQPLVDRIFHYFDADNSGRISLLELFHGISTALSKDVSTLADFYFDLYDTRHENLVEKGELISMLLATRRHSLGGKHYRDVASTLNVNVSTMLSELDKDGDGMVTRDEWKEACSKDPRLLCLLGTMFGGRKVPNKSARKPGTTAPSEAPLSPIGSRSVATNGLGSNDETRAPVGVHGVSSPIPSAAQVPVPATPRQTVGWASSPLASHRPMTPPSPSGAHTHTQQDSSGRPVSVDVSQTQPKPPPRFLRAASLRSKRSFRGGIMPSNPAQEAPPSPKVPAPGKSTLVFPIQSFGPTTSAPLAPAPTPAPASAAGPAPATASVSASASALTSAPASSPVPVLAPGHARGADGPKAEVHSSKSSDAEFDPLTHDPVTEEAAKKARIIVQDFVAQGEQGLKAMLQVKAIQLQRSKMAADPIPSRLHAESAAGRDVRDPAYAQSTQGTTSYAPHALVPELTLPGDTSSSPDHLHTKLATLSMLSAQGGRASLEATMYSRTVVANTFKSSMDRLKMTIERMRHAERSNKTPSVLKEKALRQHALAVRADRVSKRSVFVHRSSSPSSSLGTDLRAHKARRHHPIATSRREHPVPPLVSPLHADEGVGSHVHMPNGSLSARPDQLSGSSNKPHASRAGHLSGMSIPTSHTPRRTKWWSTAETLGRDAIPGSRRRGVVTQGLAQTLSLASPVMDTQHGRKGTSPPGGGSRHRLPPSGSPSPSPPARPAIASTGAGRWPAMSPLAKRLSGSVGDPSRSPLSPPHLSPGLAPRSASRHVDRDERDLSFSAKLERAAGSSTTGRLGTSHKSAPSSRRRRLSASSISSDLLGLPSSLIECSGANGVDPRSMSTAEAHSAVGNQEAAHGSSAVVGWGGIQQHVQRSAPVM